jgi:hypothetical protein
MNNKLIVISIFLILIFISFCGCNENKLTEEEKRFIGSWKGEFNVEEIITSLNYTFLSDKTYLLHVTAQGEIIQSSNGTWKILDNKLVMTFEGEKVTMDYIFSNNEKTLSLTDPNNNVYELIKQ